MKIYADKTLKTPSRSAANSLQRKRVVQREVIRINTRSGEKGELTYSGSGTIHLDDGQELKGIILVLINIPKADRNEGHGNTLMKHFMTNVVKSSPCYLDVLAVGEEGLSNEQLETWYKKFGFATIGKSATGPVMGANLTSWKERGMGVDKRTTDLLGKMVK